VTITVITLRDIIKIAIDILVIVAVIALFVPPQIKKRLDRKERKHEA